MDVKDELQNQSCWNANIEHKSDSNPTFSTTSFIEWTPLNIEINNESQKDLASIPISMMEFPKVVYMIVDKRIELETKILKDYADWQWKRN